VSSSFREESAETLRRRAPHPNARCCSRMPGPVEREQFWRVRCIHHATARRRRGFPIAGGRYAVSGGDIRNAVLKQRWRPRRSRRPDSAKAHPPAAPGGRHCRRRRSGARDAAVASLQVKSGHQPGNLLGRVASASRFPQVRSRVGPRGARVQWIALTVALFK